MCKNRRQRQPHHKESGKICQRSWLCALKNALTTWRSDRFVKGKEQQKLPNVNKRKKGINKILDLYNKHCGVNKLPLGVCKSSLSELNKLHSDVSAYSQNLTRTKLTQSTGKKSFEEDVKPHFVLKVLCVREVRQSDQEAGERRKDDKGSQDELAEC